MPNAGHAQTVDSVVDVCTGISLPASEVTDVIEAVNEPVVTDIEGILSILTFGLVDLGLSDALAAAAAGDPLTLQVLNTDGQVITAADDCNVTADAYTLDDEAGITIGGNEISGLGALDQTAFAGELDAIAIGNNANTDVGATGAVALGTDASVTAPNSVAIGSNSLADRGALIGYSAPGASGTFDSVGTVSVGSARNLRQITNVAPGTSASDAATVGQVQGALDAIAALGADAVTYDDASHASVTLDGVSGTTISNVADGTLAANSTEAVNGSQLFATNQQVTVNGDAITNLDGRVTQNETDIANLDSRVTTNEGDIANLDARVATNEIDIVNLDNRVTNNETNITNLDGRVTTNETEIANLDSSVTNLDARVSQNETTISNIQIQVANVPIGYVSDSDPSMASAASTNTTALIGATANPVTLTNLAGGAVEASSTDVVNGSQLYTTNQQVAINRTDIDQNSADIANITNNLTGNTLSAVQYSNPQTPTQSNGGTITNDATLVGFDPSAPVALHNVANGASATDAVNLGQLQNGLDAAIVSSNAYTDARLLEFGFDLQDLRQASFAGTAGALASAGLPQVLGPGRRMISGAMAHYRGETAFALGFSVASSEGQAVFRLNTNVDTHGYAGVSAGAGFSF